MSVSEFDSDLESDHLPLWIHFTSGGASSNLFACESAAPRWKCLQATDEHWRDYNKLLDERLLTVKHLVLEPLHQFTLLHPDYSAVSSFADVALGSVTQAWELVRDEIIAVGNATIGRSGSLGGHVKHHDAYWAQPGVSDAAKALKCARRRFDHYPGPETKQQYKDARRAWRKVKATAQGNQWRQLCAAIEKDSRDGGAMWRHFKMTQPKEFTPLTHVLPPSADPNSLPSSLQTGIETTARHYADVCSEHRALPFSRNHARVSTLVQTHLEEAAACSPLMQVLEIITTEDVAQVCRWMSNPCKATGPDDVHPKLLAAGGITLHELLGAIMTFSLQYSVIPAEWKQANVTALYKGKALSMSDPASYRPISVTCAVARVMERILFNRIVEIVDPQLSPAQSGFRKGRSCYDNLLRITHAIRTATARGHLPGIFLDLSKAFDSVWHEGLLHKVWAKGIKGRTWLWIRSFLTDRQLRVVQSGSVSPWYGITAGVPQGSVLAPLLFLIFINDLAESLSALQIEVALLADDVAFWPQLEPRRSWKQRYETLQSALDCCARWARAWKMKWSMSKSNVVFFSRQRSRVKPYAPTLLLDGSVLAAANSYTYLGLVLQQNLRWHQHFDRIYSKAKISSYLISRVCHGHGPPTPAVIRQLVMSIPRAAILWALPFWTPSQAQYDALTRCIVTPLRFALALPQCTSHAAILAEYGTATVQDAREQQFLAYASRLARCTRPDHLARHLYVLRQKPVHGRQFSNSFWAELISIRKKWNNPHPEMVEQDLRKLMVQRHFQQDQESLPSTVPPRPGLRAIKLQPGVSNYLYHDSKHTAVLRAKLRLDINGLQMAVVATRVSAQLNRRIPPPDPPDTRCQVCGVANADNRKHLLVSCRSMEPERSDMEFDLAVQAHDFSLGLPSALRGPSYRCNPQDSSLRFILGELNCISAIPLPWSSPDLNSVLPRVNKSSGHSRTVIPVKERVFCSDCPCCYSRLSIAARLACSAKFIQQCFHRRFPGASACSQSAASSA